MRTWINLNFYLNLTITTRIFFKKKLSKPFFETFKMSHFLPFVNLNTCTSLSTSRYSAFGHYK